MMISREIKLGEQNQIASEEKSLPDGWFWAYLGEVSNARLGKTPRRSEYRDAGSHRIVKFRDVTGDGIDYSAHKAAYVIDAPSVVKALRPLHLGDVLITASAHSGDQIGKKCAYVDHLPIVDGGVYFVGELLGVTSNPQVMESKWVYFWFRSEHGIGAVQAAVAGVHLTAGRAQNIPIPLAPLGEQKRIVAKLDELLPRVNAVRERLIRVKGIMKHFRQSVLSAACSGRLTEDWRESQGFPGESKWNQNYGLPNGLQKDEATLVPASWAWATVNQVCNEIVDCPHSTPKWARGGEICIRTTNFRAGFLDLSEVRYVSKETYEKRTERLKPMSGDVVYSREGGILGIACMIPEGAKVCLGQRMMLMRTDNGRFISAFLMHVLNSPQTHLMVLELTGGSASPHLNVKEVKQFPVPVPPPIEQIEIVRRVEALFKFADKIERRIEAELSRTEKMTQVILAKAFRAELVPTEAELLRREEHVGDKSVTDEGESHKNGPVIYTIGHSIHSLEKLVNLLNRNRIEVLVDIRSEPYSRKVPHFNKDNLEKEIRRSGLKYLFLGKELGGRPSKRQFYDQNGFVLYSKIADSPDFKSGLERVLNGIEKFRVALMCSEENPANCHRHLLVGRVLSDRKVRIFHIRGDGKIQSEDEIPNDQYEAQRSQSQQSLFVSEEAPDWKSTQSVLRRKAPNNSSTH